MATFVRATNAVTGDEVTEGQAVGRIIDPVDGAEHKVAAVSTGTIIHHLNGLSVRPGTHLAAIAGPTRHRPGAGPSVPCRARDHSRRCRTNAVALV
ncbi:hypothetical protein [Streptomyces sp. NPDC101166]|uniref:hypothetical protein n=1 Tax=Streptomyces sp. NPDC101166 TaxID=3366120 RepID=UPI00380CB1F6